MAEELGAEEEVFSYHHSRLAGTPELTAQTFEDFGEEVEQAVVFRPRSYRLAASDEVQANGCHGIQSFYADELDSPQRRCWVLPPAALPAGSAFACSNGTAPASGEIDQHSLDATFVDTSEPMAVPPLPLPSTSSMQSLGSNRQDKGAVRRAASATEREKQRRVPPASVSTSAGSASSSKQASSDGAVPSSSRTKRAFPVSSKTAKPASPAASAPHSARGPGRATVRTSKEEIPPLAQSDNGLPVGVSSGSDEQMVPLSQLRHLTAQLEATRNRNGALEGEISGLRAEAEAVKQRYEEEILRLLQELKRKDEELQHRDKELTAVLEGTQEQRHSQSELWTSIAGDQASQPSSVLKQPSFPPRPQVILGSVQRVPSQGIPRGSLQIPVRADLTPRSPPAPMPSTTTSLSIPAFITHQPVQKLIVTGSPTPASLRQIRGDLSAPPLWSYSLPGHAPSHQPVRIPQTPLSSPRILHTTSFPTAWVAPSR